jgi:hypothetical protein
VRFTVTATTSATNELAEIWLRAADCNAVQEASDNIDDLLRSDPLGVGIPSEPDRIFFVPPLGVVYDVKVADRMVTIKKYYYLA